MAQKIRRVAILGFGREGKSVLKFLRKSPDFRGAEIAILDKKSGRNYLKNLGRFDAVFRSPGVPYNLPELVSARLKGVKFSSATRLFFENAPTKNIIGITGTKGKGTTATLLYKILSAHSTSSGPAGKTRVFLAGNIGKPALDLLPQLRRGDVVVLELSSFQLQDSTQSPHTAVILDVFPDHQDAHLNLKEYYEAKASIAKNQKRGDRIFYFRNSPKSASTARKSVGRKFAADERKSKLFRPEDLKIPGHHNFKNAVMAATVAKSMGIPAKTIAKTVREFRGLEHRLEFVRAAVLGPKNRRKRHSHILENVRMFFYNDSASTNPHTTAAAIKAFPGQPKILIAGGQDKGLDYKPLAQALRGSNTKLVVLFGENKRKIARAIQNCGVAIKIADNLNGAIRIACKNSKFRILNSKFVSVLFSPGAASFDQFKNYAERGKQFKKIVNGL